MFNAHAHDANLAETFSLISRALKLMNMRGMFMALSLIRVENESLRLTCAGMPPLFIYRAATGQIEEHLQKAVPLGSINQYPYTEFTLEFRSGDLLLLMSDGLPERFNESREMLDDEAIKRMLADHGHTISPQALIEKLLALGEDWPPESRKMTTLRCSSSKPDKVSATNPFSISKSWQIYLGRFSGLSRKAGRPSPFRAGNATAIPYSARLNGLLLRL